MDLRLEKKRDEYTVKLYLAMQNCFSDDEEFSDIHINIDDFEDDKLTTLFSHVLLNVVPTRFFNKVTGNNMDVIEVHSVAERLAFQYLTFNNETKTI